MNLKSVFPTLLVSMAGLALPVFGQISISDFSTASGLQLNGNAAIVGPVLRLTPALPSQAGSTFSTSAVTLAANVSFSSFFTFRITASGGISDGDGVGADGLVFVVQTNSNSVGGAGGGIGYQGVPNSLGVEFDTYDNGSSLGDPNGNHVNFDFGGNFSLSGAVPIANRMNNGNTWSAWVDYDGTTNTLELRLVESSLIRPAAALLSTNVNLATVLGGTNAFVGFTSGTGAAWGNHDILSWEFRDTFSPIVTPPGTPGAVPEPSTYGLFGVALMLGAIAYRRRKNS